MKIILIILFLPFLMSSQVKESDVDYEIQGIFKNFEQFKFQNFKDKKNLKLSFLNESNAEKIIERKFDLNYTQEIYKAQFYYGGENRALSFIFYEISLIKRNDTIIGLVNIDKSRKKVNYYLNYPKIQDLVNEHNKFYNAKTKIEDLIIALSDRHDYGYCYLKDSDVKFLLSTMSSSKNIKKIELIKELIKSYSPEERFFGVYLLMYLKEKKRKTLNYEEKKIIKNIIEENLLIESCKRFQLIDFTKNSLINI